ncbi:hypothetical protein ACLOJK_003110 [Asimina triloba]
MNEGARRAVGIGGGGLQGAASFLGAGVGGSPVGHPSHGPAGATGEGGGAHVGLQCGGNVSEHAQGWDRRCTRCGGQELDGDDVSDGGASVGGCKELPDDDGMDGGKGGCWGGRKVEVEGGRVAWREARAKADMVVAKGGSGDCQSIGEGLKLALAGGKEWDDRFVIDAEEGVYEEEVKVTAEMNYITMYGDGPHRTVVTRSKGFDDGISLYGTATFAVFGFALMARYRGLQNNVGPTKAHTIALLVQADLSNTLLAHTHRQFYRDCTISSAIDVISSDAAAVFQNCLIALKRPPAGQKTTITAQARLGRYETTGFALQNCTIGIGDDLSQARHQKETYLGRPAKEQARTVIMQSEIVDVVGLKGGA